MAREGGREGGDKKEKTGYKSYQRGRGNEWPGMRIRGMKIRISIKIVIAWGAAAEWVAYLRHVRQSIRGSIKSPPLLKIASYYEL